LVGNATASNTGTVGAGDAALAYLTLDASGISQTSDNVSIGDTGNVAGRAFVSGGSIAQTTTGNAASTGNLDAVGVDLKGSSGITIGSAGNVNGLAVIGTLNASGSLGNQVQFTASTVDGTANATSSFDGIGISGAGSNANTITAGPNDGDVSGQVIGGANLVASNTGNTLTDTATASGTANLYGISRVDINGGMVGTNSVLGTSVGDFDATATSVAGNAYANSDVSSYGIFGSGADTINVSGGINAIAQLSNTVTATSVSGNAVATATSDAIGISGYNIHIIGNGTLNASATSSSSSLASSVAGSAHA
jgi:hypothetical protein